MSTISLGGSGIIGISYGETSLLKSNLLRAKERRDSAASNANSAKMKLQVNGSSGRIRVEADNLQSYYSSIKNNNAKIDKVIRDIDYIVRRFKEVDSRCANRIKSIGRGYKVRSGISKIGNSLISFGNKVFNGISSFFNDGMNAIKSMGSSVKNWFSSKYTAVTGWLDSHPIVGNTASFALNALAVVGAGATLFFGGPVIAVVGAVIGGALALNGLIDDGTKIYNNVANGTNKGFNALESGLKAVAGEKTGGMVYAGLNLVDFALNIPHMVKGLKNIKNIKPSLINAGKAIKSFPSKVTGMVKSFGTKGTEFIKDTGKVFKMSFNNYISDTRSVTTGANLGGEFNKLGGSIKKAISDLGDIKAQSEIRRVVLNNIEQSKIARKVSNYQEFAKKEAQIIEGVSNDNFLKSKILKMNSFQEDISSILKNEKITLDEFNSIRMKGASELTDEQRRIMMKIREQVPNPNSDTTLQKVIDGGKIDNYIKDDNPWNTVGGFITKAQDTKELSTLQEVYDGLALGYKDTPFTVGVDKDYGIIRFKTDVVDKIDIPYGPTMEGVGAKPPTGGFDTSPDPFTGHGFTKDMNGNIIPEYTMQYLKPNEGAELYRVNSKTGIEELIAKYKDGKFVKIK
ncbi:hypothetical protein UT300007_27050 [Clostridium sp. CTA-7]